MKSPYTDSYPKGLIDQVVAIFRFDPFTKEAFLDLITQLQDRPEETFEEIYNEIINYHIQAKKEQIYPAYEALFSLTQSKRATETSMKEGNAQIIRTVLEELQQYAYEVEQAPKNIQALTEEQKQKIQTYSDMLDKYSELYDKKTE